MQLTTLAGAHSSCFASSTGRWQSTHGSSSKRYVYGINHGCHQTDHYCRPKASLSRRWKNVSLDFPAPHLCVLTRDQCLDPRIRPLMSKRFTAKHVNKPRQSIRTAKLTTDLGCLVLFQPAWGRRALDPVGGALRRRKSDAWSRKWIQWNESG